MVASASDRCISGQVEGGPGSGAATMPQGCTRADDTPIRSARESEVTSTAAARSIVGNEHMSLV